MRHLLGNKNWFVQIRVIEYSSCSVDSHIIGHFVWIECYLCLKCMVAIFGVIRINDTSYGSNQCFFELKTGCYSRKWLSSVTVYISFLEAHMNMVALWYWFTQCLWLTSITLTIICCLISPRKVWVLYFYIKWILFKTCFSGLWNLMSIGHFFWIYICSKFSCCFLFVFHFRLYARK